jgi:hypothetical protein
LNAFGDAEFNGVPEFSSDPMYIRGKPVGTRRIMANREVAEKLPGDVALSNLRAASSLLSNAGPSIVGRVHEPFEVNTVAHNAA